MIDQTYFFIVVAALTLGTLVIRGFFIALSNKMTISPRVKELFTFIPAAIFPALIIPASFYHQGTVDWLAGKERIFVLVIAGIASYFYRNTLFTIAFGLALLYALKL